MDSTQDLSRDQRASFILYGFINHPSYSNLLPHKTDDSDEKLKLSLSLSCHGPSSSSSSSSSSSKKRKATQDPESDHIPKHPFKNRNTILPDTRLRIAPPDPFTIKKTLEESDVNDLARLMLAKGAVEAHVLAHWDSEMKERLKDKEGVAVKVWDLDSDTEHDMKMKIWGRSGSVIVNDWWITKFVRRRGLVKGDKIGLCWDKFDRRLVFSVLEQVPIDAAPISFSRPNHHH